MAFGGYPPPHHILADLGLDAEVDSDTSARVRTRVTPFVTGADGGVRAGVLATLVDVVGGAVGVRALRPDWMATADLTIQVVRPARGPFVEARGRVLRRGRTTLVIEAGVFEVDGDGSDVTCGAAVPAPAAWATMTFAILSGGRPTRTSGAAAELADRWSFTGAGLDAPVVDVLGISVTDAGNGVVSLPVREYLFNSIGAVQGGVMALLGEVAGEVALGAVDGSDDAVVVTDLQVAYLSLGRVGPIVSRTKVLGSGAGPGAVRRGTRRSAVVELLDDGADGRLTTVVTVVGTTVAAVPPDAVPAGSAS